MASLYSNVLHKQLGDYLLSNGQSALITTRPVMKVAQLTASATGTIIPAEANKSILIVGARVTGYNNAGTDGTAVAIRYIEFWTGKDLSYIDIAMTPNAIGRFTDRITDLPIATMPGTPITVVAVGVPESFSAYVYYIELPM